MLLYCCQNGGGFENPSIFDAQKRFLAARKDAGPCCYLQIIKPCYKRKSDVHIREEGDLYVFSEQIRRQNCFLVLLGFAKLSSLFWGKRRCTNCDAQNVFCEATNIDNEIPLVKTMHLCIKITKM